MNRRNRRGSQLIEFGLTVPILVLVLGGIIEYGMMFNQYLSVLSATRDGARWGATPGVEADEAVVAAVDQVRDSLTMLGLSCTVDEQNDGKCEILAELVILEGMDSIEVTTTVAYTPITGGLLPSPDYLSARSTFVIINQIEDTGG